MTFEELLVELHIETADPSNEHTRPGWIQFDCPFCDHNSHAFHMGHRPGSSVTNCWRCGVHRLGDTLTALTGKPLRECLQILDHLDRVRVEPRKHSGRLQLPRGIGPLLSAHTKYLRGRGFEPAEIIRLWNVQAIGIASRLPWRLFIPITLEGKMVSWTTRSIVDSGQRYISASEEEEAVPHKSLLYGEEYCRHSIVVVEGPTDAWRLGPGSAATCGTGYSMSQVLRMVKYPRRAVCFDNEPAAQKRARELCGMLEVYPGETYNIVLDSKDPGSATPREVKYVRKFLQ